MFIVWKNYTAYIVHIFPSLKYKIMVGKMRFIIMIMLAFFGANMAYAVTDNNICMQAVKNASLQTSVPLDVLSAVALTETGMKTKNGYAPWPWSMNVEGKGYRYSSKAEAVQAGIQFLNAGKTSIDMGCMQMNWRWHQTRFSSSVANAFDPYMNVLQAASYLKENYKTHGNWNKAIGAYHSGTKYYADIYMAKVALNRNIAIKQFNIPTQIASLKPSIPMAFPPQKHDIYNGRYENGVLAGREDFKLPNSPIITNTMLTVTAGSMIDFETVKKPLIDLPHSPQPLSNMTGSLFKGE